MDLTTLQNAQAQVYLTTGSVQRPENISLVRSWDQGRCHGAITNLGMQVLHIREIVLFTGFWDLPPATSLYGEGFQMLSQTAGTLEAPVALGGYTDHKHYRLEHTPGMTTIYNLALLSPAPEQHFLLAFSSCHRFTGLLRLNAHRFEVVLDTEGLALAPQERWELEEVLFLEGTRQDLLFSALAERIAQIHPRVLPATIPTGWCSWYIYGADITEQLIVENVAALKKHMPQLRYVQIDDGYARALGDWLLPGKLFPRGMETLCTDIRANNCEPAIWVAPFIAEQVSFLVKEHPDWFVQSERGGPLLSSEKSFGGWRNGPWYMLDGTHPGAQRYLEETFRTMREQWGCRYFKLDALTWGALPGGQRSISAATRNEAYRQGMAAVRRGAGEGSFLLGCNAPLWSSLGLVDGMRVTGDVARNWHTFASLARENFWRNWQHRTLWLNDPDCVLLENRSDIPALLVGADTNGQSASSSSLTEDEFLFHATTIAAAGGLVLSSDTLATLAEEKRAVLHKLLSLPGYAARFDDRTFQVGRLELPDKTLLFLFNWEDEPWDGKIHLAGTYHVSDYWHEADLGIQRDCLCIDLPAHSARALVCQPITMNP